MHKWCIANELKIHLMKTKFMFIVVGRKIVMNGKLNTDGKEIKKVDVAILVGVHIDRHFWGNSHIRFVNQCIRK